MRGTEGRNPGRASLAVVSAILLLAALVTVAAQAPSRAAVAPAPNPPIDDSCGVDVSLILDASGSINNSGAVNTVRDAAQAFLNALKDTNSAARVLQFGTVAGESAPGTQVTGDSLAPGGVLDDALRDYYSPRPSIVPPVAAYKYDGSGDPLSSRNYARRTSDQYTNWDQALHRSGEQRAELAVFITDGDPTAFDFDRPGDPFYVAGQDPPNVAWNAMSGQARQLALDRAVEEANGLKAAGTRVLAVGVGAAVTSGSSVDRLKAVSGPNVARTAADFDIKTTDVSLVSNFSDLAAALRKVVVELCSPSLTIRKLTQTSDSAQYSPAQGWSITAEPSVTTTANPPYQWNLPSSGGPAPGPRTVDTDGNGFAQFQWEPDPPTSQSTVTVTEAVQTGFTPGEFRCEQRDEDGTVTVVGPSPMPGGTFDIDVGPEQIVTCELRNSFDFDPQIAVTKTDTPTSVIAPATVTSTFEVTIPEPGNTPLRSVTVVDDLCAPVRPTENPPGFNVGDSNRNQALDTTESWVFTCSRTVQQGLTTAEVGQTNTVTATGVPPTGTPVTTTGTGTVRVFTPGVELTKLARTADQGPAPELEVDSGTAVTYEYEIRNTGNVDLDPVVLTDDQPACATPVREPDAPGNDDDTLEVGEAWRFSCTTTPTEGVVNTATATVTPKPPTGPPGTPLVPTATARVTVHNPGLELTKVASASRVVPGTDVTYTYRATNTGDEDLTDVVLSDDQTACAAPTREPDDPGNNDNVLNVGESWVYTCTTPLTEPTTNTATVTTTQITPPPVRVFVDVIAVDISLTKEALQAAVLDPSADPEFGLDVPTPRPAGYRYIVGNPGGAPLATVDVTDDTCGSVSFVTGDTNGDDRLDPTELWLFTCVTPLTRSDGSAPDPQLPAVVENTAVATGTPVVGQTPGEPISATDTAAVLVITPNLTLTKTASASVVRPRDPVTYTFEVANTGDVGLSGVSLTDDRCSPLSFVGGDDNGNGLLDGGTAPETWTFSCTRPVDFPSPDVNTAQVIVTDPLGNLYRREATAEVRVLDPAIGLTKTASSDLVLAGTEVTYTFRVTNAGEQARPEDDVLTNVTLTDQTDPPVDGCDAPVRGPDDPGNGDDLLEIGETWVYTCSAVITEQTTNTAVATGTDILTSKVTKSDHHTVAPFTTGISVTKVAEPTSLTAPGGEVTYRYDVVNTGTVPLADVRDRIADDTCADVQYVSGDEDGNDLLTSEGDQFETGPAEVWRFTCTTNVSRDTTNTVTVTGTPVRPTPSGPEPLSPDVTGKDTATVRVVPPPTTPPGGTPGLPETGTDALGMTQLAVLLVALGALLALPWRRHRA